MIPKIDVDFNTFLTSQEHDELIRKTPSKISIKENSRRLVRPAKLVSINETLPVGKDLDND